MFITIAIAVGSALLHWILQRQAAARYEQVMKEAINATKHAQSAEITSFETKRVVAAHINMLGPALAALPKTRSRKTKSSGIGEPEQST